MKQWVIVSSYLKSLPLEGDLGEACALRHPANHSIKIEEHEAAINCQ